jgi:hypothetical protein
MWYSKVTANLGLIPDFIQHYENELDLAKRDCKIGGIVEKNTYFIYYYYYYLFYLFHDRL